MKKKLLDYIIIFLICFFIAPFLFYIILSSSIFDKYNLYFNKIIYLKLYIRLASTGLIILLGINFLKYLLKIIIRKRPTFKARLISIEKLDSKSSNLGIIKNEWNSTENYAVKFKHNDEIIDITISKENIKSDLTTDEHPYVEYQYIDLIKLFNKFLNIKVHTKK